MKGFILFIVAPAYRNWHRSMIGPPIRLHQNQISAWKQEFLQNSASVLTQGKKKEQESVDTGKHYEEIERLKVEVDRLATRFLKKEYNQNCGGEKGCD